MTVVTKGTRGVLQKLRLRDNVYEGSVVEVISVDYANNTISVFLVEEPNKQFIISPKQLKIKL